MSDEQVPQGSIPPKVSPFAKPDAASPITPAAPGAPRPITVRLKPAAPAAATPAAPAPQAQEPAAATVPQSVSPRLTARVPIPELPPAGSAAVSIPKPPTAHVPEIPGVASPAPVAAPATVRLRPVAPQVPVPAAAPAAAPAAMTPAVSPLQPVPAPTPGSHPLPEGPKPPSGAQVQAAKSKTSRISLDSAIGVAPMTPMGGDKVEPKTIRLKRPADLAAAPTPKVSTAPIRQTSRIPDSVLPTPEAAAAEAGSVTQKKTLKIKRPGSAPAPEAGAAPSAEGGASLEGVAMTPISPLEIPAAPEESKVFTGIAVVAASAAAVVLLLLSVCLGSHAVGSVANMNTTASIQISGFQPIWPGTLSE